MERPAPPTAAPNLLYIDLRKSEDDPETVLDLAIQVLGQDAVGFQFFAAQKTIGLVFATADLAKKHANTTIGDTDHLMYSGSPDQVFLKKLTLQNCAFFDGEALKEALVKAFEPYGQLVFLAPMQRGHLISDQWHVTLQLPQEDAALPPAIMDILGQRIVLDVPGVRRFCNHCQDTMHIKPTCRQGQRLRARQNQLAKDLAKEQRAIDDQLQHQQQQGIPAQIPHPDVDNDNDAASIRTTNTIIPDTNSMEGVQVSQEDINKDLALALEIIAAAATMSSSVSPDDLAAARRLVARFGPEGRGNQ